MWLQDARKFYRLALASVAFATACNSELGPDPSLERLAVFDVQPRILVPGSLLKVEGRSFLGKPWGTPTLHLDGEFEGTPVNIQLPLEFESYERLGATIPKDLLAESGLGPGVFNGDVHVDIVSSVDGKRYESESMLVELELVETLEPVLTDVVGTQVVFVNDLIPVSGKRFLKGDGEGSTFVKISGCFVKAGTSVCVKKTSVEVQVSLPGLGNREDGVFYFLPAIAGMREGVFSGQISIFNRHADGTEIEGGFADVEYQLIETLAHTVAPSSVSLGKYVDVFGGGFVGGANGGQTILELSGEFAVPGVGPALRVESLDLIPTFESGRHVRYVVNEDDALAQSVDIRRASGDFTGQITPITRFDGQEIVGESAVMQLRFTPVKQVVYLRFQDSYVESLRHFGLRAVDRQIRERIVSVVKRDYATINLEVRTDVPNDYALYSVVDIVGPDPNKLGFLGYDNSPGKDTDNKRLFDRIGGVNASTQADGFPGYGGVFIQSLFAFSNNPGAFAKSIPNADPAFDLIFDPFRPDRAGTPVVAADLANPVPLLANGSICPAKRRGDQIACAIYALGNLVGTTLSHEIGHSLGLANPKGKAFHNPGDAANRLMDAGGNRPFAERAELFGRGPAKFCKGEYRYLREILPSSVPADKTPRPSCR